MQKLINLKIFVTRDTSSLPDSFDVLKDAGVTLFGFPTIEITAVKSYSELHNAIKKVNRFDYLIFSSVNAVKYFEYGLKNLGVPFDLERTCIFAVGTKTKKYCEQYLPGDIITPANFTGAAVADMLIDHGVIGKNILIPGSVIAGKELPEKLTSAGANVTTVPVYDNIIPFKTEALKDKLAQLERFQPNMFVFTSPSSFRNFIVLADVVNVTNYFNNKSIVPIGTVTQKEIENNNLKTDLLPEQFTLEGVAEAICNKYGI